MIAATAALAQVEHGPPQNQNSAQQPQQKAPDKAAVIAPSAPTAVSPAESRGTGHDDEQKTEEGAEPKEGFWQWKSFVDWKDTLAQWLMTFAGICALGVSAWAVVLLRNTLKATRDTADAAIKATKIAQDVERARFHLDFDGGGIDTDHGLPGAARYDNSDSMKFSGVIRVRYRFKNYGKTPGVIDEINHSIIVAERLEYPVTAGLLTTELGKTFAANEATGMILCKEDRGLQSLEAMKRLLQGIDKIWFCCQIRYTDVFNEPRTENFYRIGLVAKDGRVYLQPYNYSQPKA